MDENDYQKLYEKVTSSMGISSYGNSFTLSSAYFNAFLDNFASASIPRVSPGEPIVIPSPSLPKSDLDWPEDLLPGSGKMFGYIEAYRAWRFYEDSGLIGAAGVSDKEHSYLWPPKKIKQAVAAISVITMGKGGGYYACKDLDLVIKEFSVNSYLDPRIGGKPYIIGKTALWGAIIEHGGGYRAEYAYPLEFYNILSMPEMAPNLKKHIIQHLNEIYIPR